MSNYFKSFVFISLTAVLVLCGGMQENIYAQDANEVDVDIQQLTRETQHSTSSTDEIRLIWWITTEYWEAVFASDPSTSNKATDDILKIIDQYILVAVVDGAIGLFGNIQYRDRNEIAQGLRISMNKTNPYAPLKETEIDGDLKLMLEIMQPILANMLGQLGENMQFYVFEGMDKKGMRLVDPKKEGKLKIALSKDTAFDWRLPLASLIKPKRCPVDKEELSGAWKYCPYHGKKLKAIK